MERIRGAPDVGAGAIHILSSRLWSGQAYAKFALHEGYHGWPIPSLAVRGSGASCTRSYTVSIRSATCGHA